MLARNDKDSKCLENKKGENFIYTLTTFNNLELECTRIGICVWIIWIPDIAAVLRDC